jgi:3-methyl-2-oxobutanoate hydroxymethyltransferase
MGCYNKTQCLHKNKPYECFKRSQKVKSTNTLQKMKAAGEKISMITAYDYSFAKIFDAAGIEIILVGDSASNVSAAGHATTLPITFRIK